MASAELTAQLEPTEPATLRIEVVYCPEPGQCETVALRLPPPVSVLEAVTASQLAARHGLALSALRLGVWARCREPGSLLRDLDRVEIYRPLTVDPKEARRLRYQQQRPAARPNSRPNERPTARRAARTPANDNQKP